MSHASKPYVLDQSIYVATKPSVGLMLLGSKRLLVNIRGTKCTLFTDALVVLPYTPDRNGIWTSKISLPPTFRGPVNLQHVIFTGGPSWQVKATDAYEIR